MGSVQKFLEVFQRTVTRMNVDVVRNVVPVIPQRRRKERKQPEAGHSEILQIIELLQQAWKIPDAVAIAVEKRFHMGFIDDRVFVPSWVHLPAPYRADPAVSPATILF